MGGDVVKTNLKTLDTAVLVKRLSTVSTEHI